MKLAVLFQNRHVSVISVAVLPLTQVLHLLQGPHWGFVPGSHRGTSVPRLPEGGCHGSCGFLEIPCAALSYILSTYFLVFAVCLFAKHNRHFQFFFQLLDALLVSSDTILKHLSTTAK